jgi:hypothetical protein
MATEKDWKKYAEFVEWLYTYYDTLDDKGEQREELCTAIRELIDLPIEDRKPTERYIEVNRDEDVPF